MKIDTRLLIEAVSALSTLVDVLENGPIHLQQEMDLGETLSPDEDLALTLLGLAMQHISKVDDFSRDLLRRKRNAQPHGGEHEKSGSTPSEPVDRR